MMGVPKLNSEQVKLVPLQGLPSFYAVLPKQPSRPQLRHCPEYMRDLTQEEKLSFFKQLSNRKPDMVVNLPVKEHFIDAEKEHFDSTLAIVAEKENKNIDPSIAIVADKEIFNPTASIVQNQSARKVETESERYKELRRLLMPSVTTPLQESQERNRKEQEEENQRLYAAKIDKQLSKRIQAAKRRLRASRTVEAENEKFDGSVSVTEPETSCASLLTNSDVSFPAQISYIPREKVTTTKKPRQRGRRSRTTDKEEQEKAVLDILRNVSEEKMRNAELRLEEQLAKRKRRGPNMIANSMKNKKKSLIDQENQIETSPVIQIQKESRKEEQQISKAKKRVTTQDEEISTENHCGSSRPRKEVRNEYTSVAEAAKQDTITPKRKLGRSRKTIKNKSSGSANVRVTAKFVEEEENGARSPSPDDIQIVQQIEGSGFAPEWWLKTEPVEEEDEDIEVINIVEPAYKLPKLEPVEPKDIEAYCAAWKRIVQHFADSSFAPEKITTEPIEEEPKEKKSVKLEPHSPEPENIHVEKQIEGSRFVPENIKTETIEEKDENKNTVKLEPQSPEPENIHVEKQIEVNSFVLDKIKTEPIEEEDEEETTSVRLMRYKVVKLETSEPDDVLVEKQVLNNLEGFGFAKEESIEEGDEDFENQTEGNSFFTEQITAKFAEEEEEDARSPTPETQLVEGSGSVSERIGTEEEDEMRVPLAQLSTHDEELIKRFRPRGLEFQLPAPEDTHVEQQIETMNISCNILPIVPPKKNAAIIEILERISPEVAEAVAEIERRDREEAEDVLKKQIVNNFECFDSIIEEQPIEEEDDESSTVAQPPTPDRAAEIQLENQKKQDEESCSKNLRRSSRPRKEVRYEEEDEEHSNKAELLLKAAEVLSNIARLDRQTTNNPEIITLASLIIEFEKAFYSRRAE